MCLVTNPIDPFPRYRQLLLGVLANLASRPSVVSVEPPDPLQLVVEEFDCLALTDAFGSLRGTICLRCSARALSIPHFV